MIGGPAGRLEALLEECEHGEPDLAVLCCHPHPLHGGTMHNKVVYRMARGLRRTGAVVLRFNFRGVNLSEGSYDHGAGELEDARAALAFLRSRYPDLPFAVGGFSFGSRIAHRLGCETPGAQWVLCVGFPASYPNADDFLRCAVPRTFLHSKVDKICEPAPLEELFSRMSGEKKLVWIDGQDHFFAGALDELEAAVQQVRE
jgi:hypothetical protein